MYVWEKDKKLNINVDMARPTATPDVSIGKNAEGNAEIYLNGQPGGGGGTEYNAGNGIVIEDDTISVDKSVVPVFNEEMENVGSIDITNYISDEDKEIKSVAQFGDSHIEFSTSNEADNLYNGLYISDNNDGIWITSDGPDNNQAELNVGDGTFSAYADKKEKIQIDFVDYLKSSQSEFSTNDSLNFNYMKTLSTEDPNIPDKTVMYEQFIVPENAFYKQGDFYKSELKFAQSNDQTRDDIAIIATSDTVGDAGRVISYTASDPETKEVLTQSALSFNNGGVAIVGQSPDSASGICAGDLTAYGAAGSGALLIASDISMGNLNTLAVTTDDATIAKMGTADNSIATKKYVDDHSGGGSTVTGTDDGTNWTSITIDGNTKNIPAGGEGGEVAKSVENTTEKWGDTYSITANTEGLDLAVELPEQEIPFFDRGRDKIGISCHLNDYTYRGEFTSIAYMPVDDVVCEEGLSEITNNGDVWIQCKKRLDWDGETEFTESEYQFSGKGLEMHLGRTGTGWRITFALDGIKGRKNGQEYFKSWEDFFGAN